MKTKISNLIKKLNIRKRMDRFNEKYLLCTLIEAPILVYIIEIICRHSAIKPLLFLVRNPLMFAYNALLIYLVLFFGTFFRKRIFYASVATFFFLVIGFIDGIATFFKAMPVTAGDMVMIQDLSKIVSLYLPWPVIILLAVLILAVLALLIFAGIKSPKYEGKMHRLPAFVSTVVFALAMYGLDILLIFIGVSTKDYSDLATTFANYGYLYCFTESVLKSGMEKPKNYSTEKVEEVLKEDLNIEDVEQLEPSLPNPDVYEIEGGQANRFTKEELSRPNIIFIQLESFMDTDRMLGLETSEDPIPVFHSLMESCITGTLSVPSIGAGTANTEFEVVTGMNIDFFGPGEYPFKTILKQTTAESMAYVMKNLGYTASVMHNNDGTFYDRNVAYANMGFDQFISMEYMYHLNRNVNNFAKDEILTDEIMTVLRETDTPDYIMTISVQPHGDYPSERRGDSQPVFIRYKDQSKENALSYYINQIHEVDIFVGELIAELETYEEPVVLVLYGDHIPAFGLTAGDLTNDRLNETEYVVWSNFGLTGQDRDIEAFQLAARVQELLGMQEGVIFTLHQMCSQNPDYLSKFELLQYDMLYGAREVYKGINPYHPTQIHMGHFSKEPRITEVIVDDGDTFIRGIYFNEFSYVSVNGEQKNALMINDYTLLMELEVKEGDVITVSQIGDDREVLGTTEPFTYQVEVPEEQ